MPFLDPMDSSEQKFMFIFPGQGAQYRGMGSDLYSEFGAARDIYDRASNVLGFDIAEVSFSDPRTELHRTEYTQLALLTHSVACLEVFRDLTGDKIQPHVTAGHSLGEYSALVAAGALEFEEAVRLVSARAAAMARHGRGRMIALRLSADTVRSFVDRFYCAIGGCNLPEQTVVGGADDDLDRLAEFAKAQYSAAAVALKAEGAFHTYLMIKAAEEFRPALSSVTLRPPRCKVLSNYSGAYHSSAPAAIKAHLFFQIFNPVRWMWGLRHAFGDGVALVVEFGGGMGSGNRPADKIPNLQSITRSALRTRHSSAAYCAAISSHEIGEAARLALAYRSIVAADKLRLEETGVGANGRPRERCVHLYVPTSHGVPIISALDLIRWIGELDLIDTVRLISEPVEQNVEDLRWLGAANSGEPQVYLEVVFASEAAAVLHYFGSDVLPQLTALGNSSVRG